MIRLIGARPDHAARRESKVVARVAPARDRHLGAVVGQS
jgi:hypothetical protein